MRTILDSCAIAAQNGVLPQDLHIQMDLLRARLLALRTFGPPPLPSASTPLDPASTSCTPAAAPLPASSLSEDPVTAPPPIQTPTSDSASVSAPLVDATSEDVETSAATTSVPSGAAESPVEASEPIAESNEQQRQMRLRRLQRFNTSGSS